ncbi:hypothetical protein BOTBODRAFT_126641 [Botryobasidium botryosum FD-172 SS1]|uniref:ferric-chelate reductase (NADPH) n=1 Tax=Botryobasidium botryosum (strain FD-172 SS1) TaxID=930990 RepID=A0A067MT72_BOTB1|nr:hypothetical protein BOTBODRAFT_126641 [Botryobasidium botryosum FD-172 SS1]
MPMFMLAPALTKRKETPAQKAHRLWQKNQYPKELWWMIAAVIGTLSIIHLFCLVRAWVRTRQLARQDVRARTAADELVIPAQRGRVSVRRLPPSILSAFRIAAFRWSPPLSTLHRMCLSEMVFIIVYIIALLTWCFVGTRNLDPLYYANRASNLAASQIPLIVALAGKNNIISFLTGVGPEKLNVLHRASARATLVLIWVHAFGRREIGLVGEDSIHLGFIHWGITGITAFSFAALLSVRKIRNLAYEAFLITHIILIFIFMLAVCLHAPSNIHRVWPGFLVWGLDRLCRAVRFFFLNQLWLSVVPRVQSDASNVTLKKLSADTVCLTLRLGRRVPWAWSAGQHFYLVIPSVSRFPLESHPFTAASIPYALGGSLSDEKELVFIIRARDGFTKRLLERAAEQDCAASTSPALPALDLKAYVDGPYGYPPSWALYDTCILIAGGSGITYTLSMLLDLIHCAQKGTSAVRHIVFLWVIRDIEQVNWIRDTLTAALEHAPQSLTIELRIHVTQAQRNGLTPAISEKEADMDIEKQGYPNVLEKSETPARHHDRTSPAGSSNVSIKSATYKNNSLPASKDDYGLPHAKIVSGRPDIEGLLREEVESAHGSVGVDVCGPLALVQSVRKALSSDIAGPVGVLQGKPAVTLHVVRVSL